MPALEPSSLSSDNFEKNTDLLEAAIGWRLAELPPLVYRLIAEDDATLEVASVPGKKASAALLLHLQQKNEGYRHFLITETEQPLINAFFAPFASDPPGKHPTIDFLKKPGTIRVECIATSLGLVDNINYAWASRDSLDDEQRSRVLKNAREVLMLLDRGLVRMAEPITGADAADNDTPEGWDVHGWVSQGILLALKLSPVVATRLGGEVVAFDKLQVAYGHLTDTELAQAGVRIVRGALQRQGSYVHPSVILMPSFVNIGAYVGPRTMIDTWATVGSGAQIGADCHLSGGVGIGGVLEPPGARPVIVRDGCFIGSRAIIVEGVFVASEAVIGAGVVLTASTHIIDMTGTEPKTFRGYVPPRSVVIPGMRPKQFPAGEVQVPCAYIIGQRTEGTDRKTSLNAALRDFGVSG